MSRLVAILSSAATVVGAVATTEARADAVGVPFLARSSREPVTLRIPANASVPDLPDLKGDRCFPIREIVVEGVQLVDPNEVRRAVEPLAWHCLGNVLAKSVISAVNETHAAHGLVTTQAYVSPQDVKKTGVFAIKVVSGRVGRVLIKEHRDDETLTHAYERARDAEGPWTFVSAVSAMAQSLSNPLSRFEIFGHDTFPELEKLAVVPVAPGDVLDLDAVQQGIDQMNRAGSRKASAKLAPGSELGTSDVVIDLPRKGGFHVSAGYERNGAPPAGTVTAPERAHIDLSKDDLLGFGDVWSASVASGLDNNEANLGLVLPFRWTTVSVSGGYYESLAPLSTWSELYSRRWTMGLAASHVLSRSRSEQTNLDLGLTFRDSRRWINDIELTPQVATVLRIGVGQRRPEDRSVLTWGLGANMGLPLFGASPTPVDADASVPRARFFKVDGSLGYERLFEGWGKASVSVSGQWSPTALFQDDQLTLGSLTSVRGFARSPAFADHGALVRAEFAPDLRLSQIFPGKTERPSALRDVLAATQPYVFADAGAGYNVANRDTVSRSSIGTGLRFDLGRTTFGWSVAVPLSWQGTGAGPQISRLESYMNLSIKLF